MAFGFIGGGNRSTRRKHPPCRKSMTNIILYTSPWSEFELATSVVIGTDCIGSCKSNYRTITATTPTSPTSMIGFSSPRFQESQKEPKPIFSAIFPLNVIVIIFSGIWQRVKIGQIPKSNLCHCFSIEFLWKCNRFCCFLRFRDIRGLRASSSPGLLIEDYHTKKTNNGRHKIR